MQRRLALALALFAAFLATPLPAGSAGERLHLVVLHTNDVHGQVLPRPATWLRDVQPQPDSGGLSRLATAIERVRRESREQGFALVVVDAGDWFQGTPEGALEQGRSFLAAFSLVGHDALTVGNHEFDHGVDVLLGHLAAVAPPALLANARDEDGALLGGTSAYKVVERGGLRIALVGLCSAETPTISHPSTRALTWEDPVVTLARLRHELDPQVDLVLPVTHLGVGEDKRLAEAHPDLPLVVGGHSHSLLREGLRQGGTLIVQAGSSASVVGRVDLWLDARSHRVLEARAGLIELYDEPAADDPARNAALDAAAERLVERSRAAMDVVIGELPVPLLRSRDPFTSSSSGNLVADVMRARAGADVALQNRGGLRADLPAGPVTRRELFQVLPFDNHLVIVTLRGSELEALLRATIEGGETGGSTFELSGMVLELDRSGGPPRLARVLVGGEPLRPAGRYRVATNSFVASGGGGYAYLTESGPERERAVDPASLRDLVESAIHAGLDGARIQEARYRARAR